MGENAKEWLKAILSAVAVAFIVIQFVVPTSVFGISMEPCFSHGDYLLVNRQAYKSGRQPQRGDVIIFESHLKDENGEDKRLIKRVIGLPGETVEVAGGKVYINGEALEEKYLMDGVTDGTVYPVKVPEGCYFCLGDNRLHSTDSRDLSVGFVDEDDIVGEAFFRVYPFDRIGKPGDCGQ
ncbi:MAG: signal peptidase I [Emergencia sp.]